MSHARTIRDFINLMVPKNPKADMLVSFPMNTYHPYEGIGSQARMDVYAHCNYSISYGKVPALDRIHVFHGAF